MTIKKIVSLLLMIVLSLTLNAQDEVLMNGTAVDKAGKLIYTEVHKMQRLPTGEIKKIKTSYFSPDKELIAEIDSDFSKDALIPDTVFIDHRFKQKQQLVLNTASNEITMSITDKNNKTKTKVLKREPMMVAGQGFHNLLMKNFDADKTAIKFIVLPKLDYYSFEMIKTTSPIKDARRFELKLSNWLLKKLVKEITVDYHIKNKNLLSFEGLTNVDSADGDTQDLKITYSY